MNPGSRTRELFMNRNIDGSTEQLYCQLRKKISWIPDRIPIGKKLRRIGGGYVDKTTLTTTLPDGTEEKEELKIITELMKAIIQDFERKPYVTGGKLFLPKSFWYLIFWK